MMDMTEIARLWREEGVLAFQHCRACGQTIFYARTACPNCWSTDLAIKRCSGTGRIATVTFVRKGLAAEFAAQAPIVLAEIELDDGFTLISRVICPAEQAMVGAAVTLVEASQASLYQLPTFTLRQVALSRVEIAAAAAEERRAIEAAGTPSTIPALFDAAVAVFGDRALWVGIDGGPTYSYSDFADRVARCVGWLGQCGVGQGTHVGVMMPSVAAVPITWMALAKLGAVMVPINTRYTAPELDHVLDAGDVAFLLIDAEYLPILHQTARAPRLAGRVIVHGAAADLQWERLTDLASPVATDDHWLPPGQLMSVQFTSGSTGFPKGCLLPHDYWTTIATVRSRQGPPVSRMLIDMPFHYMGGQWRFLMALLLGATAYVASRPSLTHMIDRLADHKIEFCSVSPSLAKQAAHPRASELVLRWAGTMALPPELHQPLQTHLNDAPVREMYGLTETGAVLAMPIHSELMVGSGSCGLPVPFRRCMIADEAGQPLPPGAVGELCVRGPGVMLGYYKNEPATAAVFRDGWFHTGDLFSCDAHGFYTIVGRIKDVIRRSGENISATEVEHVVCSMPDIVEAAAIPVPDALRGEELKVCVVLQPGSDLSPDRIRAFCQDRLAAFKLPRYLEYLPELPKTSSGKIAKPALVARVAGQLESVFDFQTGVWG